MPPHLPYQIASAHDDVEVFFKFFFKVYKNVTIEKLDKTDVKVPASLDPETGIQSQDVLVSPNTAVSARIYAPKEPANSGTPLLAYFHGGGFSAASLAVHRYGKTLVWKAKIVVMSLNYRLAPESPLPLDTTTRGPLLISSGMGRSRG